MKKKNILCSSKEKQWIKTAIEQKKKIVGLCLGAQLQKHPHWEAGWQPIQLSNGDILQAFQWHRYSFELPQGAERTGTNAACANQSFRFKDQILTYQPSLQKWYFSELEALTQTAG